MKTEKTADMHWLEGGLSLKAVSKILNIPASTLRYWDKEGLVAFERNWQNDYRQVSVNTLLDLLDVLDYREMDVPIGKIKQIPQMTTGDLSQLLAENRAVLQGKIAKLEQTLAKIDLKEQALQRLKALEQTEPTLIYRQMPPVYRVDLQDTDEVKKYLVPFQSADLLHADNPDHWQAGMWTENRSGEVLRTADRQPMPYLNGLLRFGRDGRDNSARFISLAYKMGYRPQYIVVQYLAAAHHPEYGLCDYHECWVELVAGAD